MGNRRHGTWCQMHEDVHDHEKTLRLAAALTKLGVPEAWASDVAVGQLHRLSCWAARDGSTGRVGHLTDTRFAQVVRWTRSSVAKLRAAWRDSGFLDDAGTLTERIHDFADYFFHLIRKRVPGAGPAPDEGSNDPPREGQSGAGPAPDRRPKDDGPAPDRRLSGASPAGARDRAGARAFRNSETPNTGTLTHTNPKDGAGLALGNGVCGATPPPGQNTPGSDPDDLAPDGDEALLRAWNAERQRRKLGPQTLSPDHEGAFVGLRNATGGDADLALAVLAAYFRQDDQFLADAAWSIKVFPHRMDAALVEARKRTATRPTTGPALVLPRIPGATGDELRAYARPATQPFTREEEQQIDSEIRAKRTAKPESGPRWRPKTAADDVTPPEEDGPALTRAGEAS